MRRVIGTNATDFIMFQVGAGAANYVRWNRKYFCCCAVEPRSSMLLMSDDDDFEATMVDRCISCMIYLIECRDDIVERKIYLMIVLLFYIA